MKGEYEVIHTDQLTRVSETRGLENYYRVQIRTSRGVVLSVDIDEEDYTPEKTGQILSERAKNANEIMKLGG